MFFGKKKQQYDINTKTLPKHIAIIMDGNGRWATKRGFPKQSGHRAGAKALEKIITAAREMGIQYLTVYAFSTENWKRSDEEVADIMNILRQYLTTYFSDFLEDNIKMKVIGDVHCLDKDIQDKIIEIEMLSKDKDGMIVNIALNYGGRDELRRGVTRLAEDVQQGKLDAATITEDTITSYLDTADCPDPELLIRTSGEERISNFLLWQLAYTEFYFTATLWPDFDANEFKKAVNYYQNRERRFGGRLR